MEMDAGLMDGSSLLFGAVGAMPDIKNPILVAKLLVQEQNKGLLPLGRVPPLFMVGEGARDWAVRHGVPRVSQESLVSEKANKLFKHYKRKLESFTQSMKTRNEKRKNTSPSQIDSQAKQSKSKRLQIDDQVTDTVGVVVLDCQGNVASTVSSGGIALKQPGRVGQASCFGCGCWAQNRTSPHGRTVGVSTTGCGEHLVRTFLAKECAAVLGQSNEVPLVALRDVMKVQFAESEFLRDVSEKLGGAICLYFDPETGRGEFLWTHTTSSMGIAFQTTDEEMSTAKMSRLPQDAAAASNSTTILVESVPFSTLDNNQAKGNHMDCVNNVVAKNDSADVQMTVESAKA